MKKRFYVILIIILTGVIVSGCAKKAVTKAEGETVAKPAAEEKAPAPKEEPIPAAVEEKKMLELKDAFFDFDKSLIRDDAKSPLQNNGEFLRANKNTKIVIEGHCDERGTNEYNLALGQRRAESAKRNLTNLGIDASRLSTISYGEERPFCKEQNETCWQSNRRAHFIIK